MAEHMQELAKRSVQGLLASLYSTTGHRPNLEASCEFLNEVNPSTGLIVRRTQKSCWGIPIKDLGYFFGAQGWLFVLLRCQTSKIPFVAEGFWQCAFSRRDF